MVETVGDEHSVCSTPWKIRDLVGKRVVGISVYNSYRVPLDVAIRNVIRMASVTILQLVNYVGN